MYKSLILILTFSLLIISACNYENPVASGFPNDKPNNQECILNFVSGGTHYTGLEAQIRYVPEIYCYVFDITKGHGGVSIPLVGQNIKIDITSTCQLAFYINGVRTTGIKATISYYPEMNCYVLDIEQNECGESVPLINTNLNILIQPQ